MQVDQYVVKKGLTLKITNYSLRCNSETSLRRPERSQRRLWGDVFNASHRRRIRDFQISPLWDAAWDVSEMHLRCIHACWVQEISLKESTLIWRTLKLLFILFNSLDIYRCTSEVIELQLNYFVFFPCTWRIKFLNTLKTKVSLAISCNVWYVPRHRTRQWRWL